MEFHRSFGSIHLVLIDYTINYGSPGVVYVVACPTTVSDPSEKLLEFVTVVE